jgi:signal transduction histidine kinase
VLLNLFQNAIDAMPQGGILTISCKETRMPRNRKEAFLIRISDTGFGMSKEDVEKIFDPFFTKKKSGTGLGLAISYQIIKKHEGIIRVESVQGSGTTFSVYLPRT